MSLFTTPPSEPNVPTNPNDKGAPHRSIHADAKFTDFKNLLTHVAGSKWVLPEYYSQYLGPDDETSPVDIQRDASLQSYKKIIDMEIRVTTSLSSQPDTNSREFDVSGEAVIYAGIIPNVGDHFTAEVGDGRKALLVVDEVEQSSITTNTLYQINYSVVEFIPSERYDNLELKTIETQHFVKEFVQFGKNPLLVESQYVQFNEIRKHLDTLPVEYLRCYFDKEHATCLVPDQEHKLYDPFVIDMVKRMAPDSAYDEFLKVQVPNIQATEFDSHTTLWNVILERNDRGLDFVSQIIKPHFIRYRQFTHYFGTIHYSGIEYAMLYEGATQAKDYDTPLKPSEDRVFSRPVAIDLVLTEDELSALGSAIAPQRDFIKSITVDEYYVLSEAFYHSDIANMSILEFLVHEFVVGNPVHVSTLLRLCESSVYWNHLERFYYLPILITLLQHAPGELN